MGHPIIMPSLGMFTAEGSLTAWLKPSGAEVEVGEPIVEVTTEKTTAEIVAPVAGIVHQVAEVGTILAIQDVIGYILRAGEVPPSAPERNNLDPGASSSSSSAGAPGSSAQSTPVRSGERAPASPIARRLAAEYEVDLATIVGSGPGGRIVEADVKAAFARARANAASTAPPPALPAAPAPAVRARIALTGMRRTIADRLRSSLATAAPVTLGRETEVERLVAARSTLSDDLGASVPFDALFVRLFAVALAQRPELNAIIDGDMILVLEEINIGFAVSVAGGLLVPVVPAADQRPLKEVVVLMRELSERAMANRLRPEDARGGTATITNLGAYGVDVFTPILNPPQSAILGIGRIMKRAVVVDDHLEMRATCALSLTFDHRVVDGVPAAQLLGTVAALMSDSNLVDVLKYGIQRQPSS